ncbi:MAG: hypothetical protein ABIQ01_05750 [Pseudolysinimonas sp.]
MTAAEGRTNAEEIAAAMARLTDLRNSCTPGAWLVDEDDKVSIWYADGGATILTPEDAYPRGDNHPAENAMLVVLLHGTIEAQLAILRAAPADQLEPFAAAGEEHGALAVLLARAINGVPLNAPESLYVDPLAPAQVWDAAIAEARKVMNRRKGTYEADIDLLALENPYETAADS